MFLLRLIHLFIILCLLWPASISAEEITLPDIGSSSKRLSSDEEKRLGEAFMRQVRQELNVIDDPEIEEYIWNLGYKLVSNSDHRSRQFYFFAVNDPTINAFAGPAGYIGVNAGLLLAADDESELAAVVAHEIAHITQRHLDRAFDAADKMSIPTAAALVAAIILGSRDINIAEAAIAATLAANIQTQINFTRANEREADHMGMQILAQSRFDPNAMPHFFQKLQQQDRLYESQVPDFLRTHPVTTERISESSGRARQYRYLPSKDNEMFYLVREKLRVMTSENLSSLVRRYEANIHEGNFSRKWAEIYGYSLALLATHQYDAAKIQAERLLQLDQERISYLILLAQIEIASNNMKKGLETYRAALHLTPYNHVISQNYARALLLDGQTEEAKRVLKETNQPTQSPSITRLLAQAERESGNIGRSHVLLAEYYYQNGYTRTAIEQLNLALRQQDTSKAEALQIKARISELKDIASQEKDF